MHQICLMSFASILLTLLLCGQAQALFKVVAPDGSVSYTDQEPLEQNGKVVPLSAPKGSSGSTPSTTQLQQLPFLLREASSKHPVVFYSAENCEPCTKGRSFLKNRGIPFIEYVIVTNKDSEMLQQKTGGRETPVMVVGSQVNRGFDSQLWNEYLDAAGYPNSSMLPSSYVYVSPKPLTPPPDNKTQNAQSDKTQTDALKTNASDRKNKEPNAIEF